MSIVAEYAALARRWASDHGDNQAFNCAADRPPDRVWMRGNRASWAARWDSTKRGERPVLLVGSTIDHAAIRQIRAETYPDQEMPDRPIGDGWVEYQRGVGRWRRVEAHQGHGAVGGRGSGTRRGEGDYYISLD